MPNWLSGRPLMLFLVVRSPTTEWMQQEADEVRN
jgi:hypothetical protein